MYIGLDLASRSYRPRSWTLAGPPKAAPRAPGIDRGVVSRIDEHAPVIERLARELSFDPNIVRGIIAAESGGRAGLVAKSSNYTGLMQAGQTAAHKDPEVSIRAGIAAFKEKLASIRRGLKPVGIDLDKVDRETMVRWVMSGYNAGQGTVIRAVQSAARAGDYQRWFEPDHFQGSLLYYGAYAVPDSCLGSDGGSLASALATLESTTVDALRGSYGSGGKWKLASLRKALRRHTSREIRSVSSRLKDRKITITAAIQGASPILLCALRFKHSHIPGYVNKVLRYMRYYKGRAASRS